MFRKHIKFAWRNLGKSKLFTLLNIAGLAIGLCVCIILFSYVRKELSYDKMYSKSENIYRMNLQTLERFNNEIWAAMPNAVGPAMIEEVPEVKRMSRFVKDGFFDSTVSIKIGEEIFSEKNLYMADSDLFEMFDFNFIEGTRESAFSQPNSIVLSQAAKERLFGSKEAMGEILFINDKSKQITGIYANLPEQSIIDCSMVYNIADTRIGTNLYWDNASFTTFLELEPDANLAEVENKATALIDKYVNKEAQYYTEFILQPLQAIYLYSTHIKSGSFSKLGSIARVKSLLLLSLLVLGIACINYMNLATANSSKRAKGIGVNKILGASRRQMLLLLYIETGIMVFFSLCLAYIASFLALPLFTSITGGELSQADLLASPILIGLALVWIVVTLVAGSYPAISISAISPLALIGKLKLKGLDSEMLRKALVVFQFTTSIVLILVVSIFFQQMSFMRNTNLGYQPNGVLAVSLNAPASKQQIENLVNSYKSQVGVQSVSATQTLPGVGESIRAVNKSYTDDTEMPIRSSYTYGGVVETLNLNLLAGTELPQNIAANDSLVYALINEKILAFVGYDTPEEAIGEKLRFYYGGYETVITGVLEDFAYKSLKEDVGGYIYYKSHADLDGLSTLLVRYNTGNLPQLIDNLKNTFTNVLPDRIFDFEFLEEHVAQLYASEAKTASMLSLFSGIAIFIACLGLFGLAAFTAEQRQKEIGVRKVLGASVLGVTKLLTKDFLKLVGIAFLIAVPIAYWLMQNWLQGFAFRTQIHWGLFVIVGLLAGGIAFITISSQAIKAAIANPIKSLRTE